MGEGSQNRLEAEAQRLEVALHPRVGRDASRREIPSRLKLQGARKIWRDICDPYSPPQPLTVQGLPGTTTPLLNLGLLTANEIRVN